MRHSPALCRRPVDAPRQKSKACSIRWTPLTAEPMWAAVRTGARCGRRPPHGVKGPTRCRSSGWTSSQPARIANGRMRDCPPRTNGSTALVGHPAASSLGVTSPNHRLSCPIERAGQPTCNGRHRWIAWSGGQRCRVDRKPHRGTAGIAGRVLAPASAVLSATRATAPRLPGRGIGWLLPLREVSGEVAPIDPN